MRVCLAMLLAMVALPVAADDLVPVSAFARLPQVSGFDVSPSGNRVLMFQPAGDSLHLVVIDLVAKTTRLALASDPDRFFFNWCRFANEDRILCSVRAYIKLIAGQDTVGFKWYRDGRVIVTRLFGVDHDGAHFTEMVPAKVTHPGEELVWNSQFQDRIINWLPDDRDHVLIELNRKERMYPDVYLLDVNRNTLSTVAKNSPPVSSWEATDTGKIMLGVGLRDQGPVVFVRDGRTLIDRTPPNAQYDTLTGVLGFAPDERSAYVAMDAGDGHSALYQVGVSDLRTTATVISDPEFDVFGGLIRDPKSRQPIARRVRTRSQDDRMARPRVATALRTRSARHCLEPSTCLSVRAATATSWCWSRRRRRRSRRTIYTTLPRKSSRASESVTRRFRPTPLPNAARCAIRHVTV